MYRLHLFIFCALLLGGLASCKTQTVDPGIATTFTNNEADIKTYAVSKGLSGSTTGSGLYYALTKAGSSTVSAALGKELEFMYKLYVLSGPSNTSSTSATIVTDKLIDSTYAKTPTFVPFITGTLKAGLEEGLLKMHEGDQATLLLPSILAFGDVASSNGLIPANSPVRFDVTLNRARTEDQQIDEYIATDKKLTLTEKTSSGLRFFLKTANPAGDSVKTATSKGLTITIKYVGKQLRGRTAFGFDSTSTGLNLYKVTGFTEGLAKLRVGETATFILPSSIGYSTTGLIDNELYKVAPYTPLRYDVEVVSAK